MTPITFEDFFNPNEVAAEHLEILQQLMGLLGDDDASNVSISSRNDSYVQKSMARYFKQLKERKDMETSSDHATEEVWRRMEETALLKVNATLQAARKRE